MAMSRITKRFNLRTLIVITVIAFCVLLLMHSNSNAHPPYTPSFSKDTEILRYKDIEILERTRLSLGDGRPEGDGECCTHSGTDIRTTKLVTGGRRRPPRHRGGKPWYITGGDFFPIPSKNCITNNRSLWYDRITDDDRIIDQLMYTIDDPINVDFSISSAKNFTEQDPANVDPEEHSDKIVQKRSAKIIKIFFRGPWYGEIEGGRHVFLRLKCPVNACRIVKEYNSRSIPDVVVLSNNFWIDPANMRRPEQLWIVYEAESPFHAPLVNLNGLVNLTATYRRDSDIVRPYGKWVHFDEPVAASSHSTNFAAGKSKKVAMFVSNCNSRNNRMTYAKELGKYIQVDIYGKCGTLSCPRSTEKECFEMLSRDYKFYLAFENSNCRDYITEKFFQNGLGNLVVPIVMGAHPNDYARSAPPHSYIHVDDFSSPEELAEYLNKLDKNDYLYNQYFKWRVEGEFISTHIFCRFCAMAHYVKRYPKNPSYYHPQDLITKWWKQEHVCTSGSWKSVPDIFA